MGRSQRSVVNGLEPLLAGSYALDLKSHNDHWNVIGPMFTSLHTLFEAQHTELALAVDEIAERLRALGARAPGSDTEFAGLSAVTEDLESPGAEQMIESLVSDQQRVIDIAREVASAAESMPDQATTDLATRRLDVHEKNAWMLRSHLE